jgi:diguanylate cyclase (GGDEF)-like protein/PAS domain S-box-containing protein
MAKDYDLLSKEELIKIINDQEKHIKQLMMDSNQEYFITFPWAGNLGQWYWFYDTNKVTFNDKKVSTLGYNPDNIGTIGFEFFTSKLHPDDYDHVMKSMKDHLMGLSEAYEVEYRIKHKEGYYLWYYDRGVVTKRDDKGNPVTLQGIVFDITETKKIEERLRYLSERDELTHFYNRRMFFHKLEQLVTEKIPFSLLMFDIDYFKHINDQYGHLVGDDVLRRISHFIFEEMGYINQTYRYGGEEFFILLPHKNIKEAKAISQQIHQGIQHIIFPEVNQVTVSMGVVEHHVNETIDDIVKRVDDYMYQAKRTGRNKVISE